jgi:hypothetical protein
VSGLLPTGCDERVMGYNVNGVSVVVRYSFTKSEIGRGGKCML